MNEHLKRLHERRENSEKRKRKLIAYLENLKKKYKNKEISYAKYLELIHQKRDGRTIEGWIHYFHLEALECHKKIQHHHNKKAKRLQLSIIIGSVIFLFLLSVLSNNFFSIGFLTQEDNITQTIITQFSLEDLNLEFNEDAEYEWQLENQGQLNSIKLSGIIQGQGEVKVYLDDVLILDTSNIKEQEESGRRSITALAVENLSDSSEPEQKNNEKETVEEEPRGSIEPEIIETPTEEIIKEKNQTNEIDNKANNSQEEQEDSESSSETKIRYFSDICEETCNLESLNLTQDSYILQIEIDDNTELEINEIKYSIIKYMEKEIPSEEPSEKTPTEEEEIIEQENETLPREIEGETRTISAGSPITLTSAMHLGSNVTEVFVLDGTRYLADMKDLNKKFTLNFSGNLTNNSILKIYAVMNKDVDTGVYEYSDTTGANPIGRYHVTSTTGDWYNVTLENMTSQTHSIWLGTIGGSNPKDEFDYITAESGNTAPTVTLISPADGSSTNDSILQVTWNVTDSEQNFTNCTGYFNNGTTYPVFVRLNVLNATEVSNSTNITLTSGTWTWWVTCNDGINDGVSEERTLIIDQSPPIVIIIHPWGGSGSGHYHDQNDDVDISVNVTDLTAVDTILANITFPNGSSTILSKFGYRLPSDDFNTDTEGINWMHANLTGNGQTCLTDIDGDAPGKMFFSLNGGSGPSMHCAYNGVKRIVGNYDLNLTFNITHMEDDSFFTLKVAPTDSLLAFGLSAYISLIQNTGGNRIYRFAYYNGTTTYQENIATTDTYGKFRIKRSNMNENGTPILNLYYWNNTGNDWIESGFGNISMPGLLRPQFVQIKPGSQASNYGALNMTVDDFQISGDNYTFVIFNQTNNSGIYNVTIIANDTYGYTNDTEKTFFEVRDTNNAPSIPFIEEPDIGEIINGVFNISWEQVVDEEEDSLQFNITLLNPNNGTNATIVTNYGDNKTIHYEWNTSQHLESHYGLRVTVFENETAEGFSNSNTLGGNFTIDHNPPQVVIIHPKNQTFNTNESVPISLNINDIGIIDTTFVNITSPNSTYYLKDFLDRLSSDSFDSNTTLGTKWEFRNDSVASGHNCHVDINETIQEKAFLKINGTASLGSTLCGLAGLKRISGDFDINVSFNASHMEDDSFFVFRINNERELFSSGIRVFISLGQTSGTKQYRSAFVNSTGINLMAVDTNDTYGKMRITKTNSTGTPIFNTYYWNNTGNEWISLISSAQLNESLYAPYVHIYLKSSGTNLGSINVSADDFLTGNGEDSFVIFNQTSQEGQYNISIFVNDSVGHINNTETTTFHIAHTNQPPALPIITAPSPGEIVGGIINITWDIIVDPEKDKLRFNITLLNPNNGTNATIVTNYGDNETIHYEWNTSKHLDSLYNLRVTVFENETAEGYSSSGTLIGNFTIDNTPPTILINSPSNITYNTSNVLVNISASDNNLNTIWYNWNGTNITYSSPINVTFNEGKNTLYAYANDTAGNENSTSVTFTIEVCSPNLVNTSWSDWINLSCIGNQINQSRNRTQYDDNFCGEISNVTYYEYQLAGPTYANTSWTDWVNISCLPDDTMNQSRNLTQYDIYGCASNTTFIEYRNTLYCDYCSPNLVNTSWSDWYNVTSCLPNNTITQERNLTQYDDNFCGEIENTTFYEYQYILCDYDGPPNIVIIHPTNDTYNNETQLVNISVSDSDIDSIWYNWFGTNTSYTSPIDIIFNIGSNTLHAYANDTYGNENSTSVTFYINVSDISPPIVNIINPENNSLDSNGYINFKYSVNDGSTVDNCSLIINNEINYTEINITKNIEQEITTETNLGEGNYLWYINCTDENGNRGMSEIRNISVVYPENYTNETLIINETILDSSGNPINAIIEFIDSSSGETDYNTTSGNTTNISSGTYNIKVTLENNTIQTITFIGANIYGNITDIFEIDDSPPQGNWSRLYAINPLLNYPYMQIEITSNTTATGNALYKCANWSFANQNCTDDNWIFYGALNYGQTYTFSFLSGDPGFGETNTTLYVLHNESDSQYSSYKQMKNVSADVSSVNLGPVSVISGSPGIYCWNEKWLTPNWTSKMTVNGTWEFSIYTYSEIDSTGNLNIRIFKYNETSPNEYNLTTTNSNTDILQKNTQVLSVWNTNISYGSNSIINPEERTGIHVCLNVTSATKSGNVYLRIEQGTPSSIKFPNTEILNAPPQITYISPIPNINPTENSYTPVTFYVTMYDEDGVADLNDTSVRANFTKSGEPLRENLTCLHVNDIDSNSANYSCTINMWYFDEAGNWNISVYGADIHGNNSINDSTFFQYNLLRAIVISPINISFGSINLNLKNQTANNDPTIINNTGNANLTSKIAINAINLLGETNASEYLAVENFSIGLSTGGSPPAECSGIRLQNATDINITGAVLERGNLSLGGGVAQEQLYYCIKEIDSISAQTYSTQGAGNWLIKIILSMVVISTKRKRRKRRKIIVEDLSIPITIFTNKLGGLEGLVKYLRENLGLTYHEIAELLNRDDRTIWTAYNKSVKKQPTKLIIKKTLIFMPIPILKNRKLTILEAIIVYLKDKGMRYIEIAELLNRDQRNIWTIHNRAIKK